MADTTRAIDFNSDLGESFGHWTLGDDAAMVRLITSANLACGLHAGDFTVMDQTVAMCKAAVPQIRQVVDVTDHAGGSNPYFTAAKGAESPFHQAAKG